MQVVGLPPLRERSEDVRALVEHFVQKHGQGRPLSITPAALTALASYAWPGNVRQLENEIARAVAMATSGEQLFSKYVCNTCHKPDSAALAPILTGLIGSEVTLADGRTVTADLDYVRRSILEPTADVVSGYNPVMPMYRGQINEEELVQILQYIRSLAEGESEAGDSASTETPTPGVGVQNDE